MRILIAPDKFKGCLTARQVAEAIAAGLRTVDPSIDLDLCPMADGGEGTVAALVAATKGRLLSQRVTGPLPDMQVDATFGILGDAETAVIEMAAASGLALLQPQDRNPLHTTTYGTGELLNAAIRAGARQILLGIGGSATIDAGIGCAQATGHTIVLQDGDPVSTTEPLVGADLARILLVKRHRGETTDRIPISVACDVQNPLCGPTGAAEIFGPQKGATPAQVRELDAALQRLAERLKMTDIAALPGSGAAGGLGFGMVAWYGAQLRRGIDIVIDAVNLRQRLRGADLCITGEGRLDNQSLQGKTVLGVAHVCRDLGIPCFALAGQVVPTTTDLHEHGISGWRAIQSAGMSVEESMRDATQLLTAAVQKLLKEFIEKGDAAPESP